MFSHVSSIQAAQLKDIDNRVNTIGIVIEKSNKKLTSLKTSSEPDLGDDQTFPFIPGFINNSDKD